MGNSQSLRIHKVIGYGLTDIALESSGKMNDLRLDLSGYVFNSFDLKKYHLQNFFDKLLKANEAKWKIELYSMDYYPPNVAECIHFGTTLAKTGIVLICPPNKAYCWKREDDIIDFCDSDNEIKRDSVKMLDGIPSCRYMMDSRNGRKLPTIQATDFTNLLKRYRQSIPALEKLKIESTLVELASEIGFDRIDDAERFIAPLVPEVVMEFCVFLNLFSKRETALALRPMLYTYWR